MTMLTLELPQELFERLRQEAQRLGKPAHEIAEAWLAERLQESTSAALPAYPELAPDVREMLAHMSPDELIVPPQGTLEDAIRLLQSWNEVDETEAEEQADTLKYLTHALDEDRLSNRPLFPKEAAEE